MPCLRPFKEISTQRNNKSPRCIGYFYEKLYLNKRAFTEIRVFFITGTPFIPPPASQVPTLMQELFTRQLPTWRESYHTVTTAALAHQQFVNIHPFIDGNGRIARLLNNWLLLSEGYPPLSIPLVLRMEYLNALRACQDIAVSEANPLPLSTFIAEVAYEGLKDYLRIVNRLLSA
jgi:Fic family protein